MFRKVVSCYKCLEKWYLIPLFPRSDIILLYVIPAVITSLNMYKLVLFENIVLHAIETYRQDVSHYILLDWTNWSNVFQTVFSGMLVYRKTAINVPQHFGC